MATKLIDLELLAYYDSKLRKQIADTYATKEYVDEELSKITSFEFKLVDELPETGSKSYIYLVPKNPEQDKNVRDEYIWVNDAWEMIGNTKVDLSEYQKIADADKAYADKITVEQESEKTSITLLSKDSTVLGSAEILAALASRIPDPNNPDDQGELGRSGLMTAADKAKLDASISLSDADGKFVTDISSKDENTKIIIRQTVNGVTFDRIELHDAKSANLEMQAIHGLMSAADKTKLDDLGLAENSDIDALF